MNQENSQTIGQENGMHSSAKQGEVKKCPVCGAIVMAYQAKCDDCGYEFRGVDANKSSQILAAKLAELEKTVDPFWLGERQASVIRTFPIPTTKEDLVEFASSMVRQNPSDPDLKEAYQAKASEAITKLQILFPNEPFVQLLVREQESQKQKDKEQWSYVWKLLIGFGVIVALVAIADLLT